MLILFVGKKESGKSTAGDYLKKVGFTNVNFKDELDSEIFHKFPELLNILSKRYKKTPWELIYTKPLVPEIRALKRNFGTEVRRADDPKYWVRPWKKRVEFLVSFCDKNVYADDARFLNEAKAGEGLGAIKVEIRRSQKSKDNDTHLSETEQNDISHDYVIYNDGTVKDLHEKVKNLLMKIMLDGKGKKPMKYLLYKYLDGFFWFLLICILTLLLVGSDIF